MRVSSFEAAGFHLLDDVPMTQIIKPKICITNLEGVFLLYDYKILHFTVFLQTLQEESLFALFWQIFFKHSKAFCLDVFVAKDAAFNSINPVLKLKDIFNQIVQGFLKPGIIG